MDDLLSLWRTRLRILSMCPSPETQSIIYQLNKCIKDLEGQIEYERSNNVEHIRAN